MFGRRRRREERLYWKGFRDALVRGVRDPSKPTSGLATAEQPRYRQGFEDGKRAAKRTHRDALVSEISKLSLEPGDKLVVRCKQDLMAEQVVNLSETLRPHFPDNKILVLMPSMELSAIRPESIVVQTVLDGKVIDEVVAKATEDSAARS